MIPICQAPKRFVAALNKERYFSSARFNTKRKDSVIKRSFFYATPHTFLSCYREVPLMKCEYQCFSTVAAVNSVVKPNPIETIIEERKQYTDSMNLTGPRTEEWYTGKYPKVDACPGMSKEGYLYSLPQLAFHNNTVTKQQLHDYFNNTWTLTEVLLASLQGEEAFMRPPYHDLRHPMIFYYGHPAAVYVNKLRVAGLLKNPINAYFESIFETGVDEMSWDDLSKNHMTWPSVAEVHQYRQTVYATITEIIDNLTPQQLTSVSKENPIWALLMGFEHERIHIETSSFLINEMPLSYLRTPDYFPPYHPSIPTTSNKIVHPIQGQDYPKNEMISIPSQSITIGKPNTFPSYGWDNEYGTRQYTIPSFTASKYKISNGEYYEFVNDQGYARMELWSEVGWKWRTYRNIKCPTFWKRSGPHGHHDYDLRVLFDMIPMPWDWPVVINYHEAHAFANWKSSQSTATSAAADGKKGKKKIYRILTELEHHAIRDNHNEKEEYDQVLLYNSQEMPSKTGSNLNLAYSSMSPVHALPPNTKGFHDVFGNAWEWTEDYFSPLTGFTVHPYYEDFSTPCFDGLHHIIQGGSFISTGNEASQYARFHFRPHFYQHASCRLVECDDDQMVTSDTDAPGPYVGNYPFRRSNSALLVQGQVNNDCNNSNDNKNVWLSKHFGTFPPSDTTANAATVLPTMQTLYQTIYEQMLQHNGTQQVNNNQNKKKKVLEVGCGIGGLTFALAATTDIASIIGIDHSLDAITLAKQIVHDADEGKGKVEYTLSNEGHSTSILTASIPSTSKGTQLDFRYADPMCLPSELHGFDVVILHDILDKLSSPNALLGRLGGIRGLVGAKGCLMVIGTYQWSSNRTPESLWLGGQTANEESSSEDGLIKRLSEEFQVSTKNVTVPVCWQTTAKDIQGKIYTITCFIRK